MSSECYWCIVGKPAYGNQLGTMGYPFACCHKCHVFCCGHHGQRDDGGQEFHCFDCDKTILLVSAIDAAHLEPETVEEIAQRSIKVKNAGLGKEVLVSSLDEFVRRKPGYGNYFEFIEDSYIDYTQWEDPFLQATFSQFPRTAQTLLIAAAMMIADTDTEQDLLRLGDPLFLYLKVSVKVPVL